MKGLTFLLHGVIRSPYSSFRALYLFTLGMLKTGSSRDSAPLGRLHRRSLADTASQDSRKQVEQEWERFLNNRGPTYFRAIREDLMKNIAGRCLLTIIVLLLLLLFPIGLPGVANAQVPTKIITIYNDTKTETLYPVLAGFVGNVDLWLQAQLGVTSSNAGTQTFCNSYPDPGGVEACLANGASSGKPPALFRAYINLQHGILPGESVSIIVPFYTQLTEVTPSTIGKYSGQYIDWWNAARIFFYDGSTAITGAYNYNVDQNGKVIPPTPVTRFAGAPIPSCAPNNKFTCDPVKVVYYVGVYPTGSIPFQLGEYTFASAEGPPPGGLGPEGSAFSIDLGKTNFNISAVDGVYLPVAMEAMLKNDPTPGDSEYLGTDERVTTFRQHLENFKTNGPNTQWPYYWPSYFNPANPTAALPIPPATFSAYPLPSIPSANVVFAESYKVPAPAPPVLSSNTTDDEGNNPMLGSTAASMVDLWNKCTSSSGKLSATCQQIQTVYKFFKTDYNDTCGFSGSPSTPIMLREVYGWAQFPGCPSALAASPGYGNAIVTYCDLQYNYLIGAPEAGTPKDDRFNPYTELIHKSLQSNAYAFSIDDKAAFKSVPAAGKGTSPGLIITIGGPEGLVDRTQTPLPDADNFHLYCH